MLKSRKFYIQSTISKFLIPTKPSFYSTLQSDKKSKETPIPPVEVVRSSKPPPPAPVVKKLKIRRGNNEIEALHQARKSAPRTQKSHIGSTSLQSHIGRSLQKSQNLFSDGPDREYLKEKVLINSYMNQFFKGDSISGDRAMELYTKVGKKLNMTRPNILLQIIEVVWRKNIPLDKKKDFAALLYRDAQEALKFYTLFKNQENKLYKEWKLALALSKLLYTNYGFNENNLVRWDPVQQAKSIVQSYLESADDFKQILLDPSQDFWGEKAFRIQYFAITNNSLFVESKLSELVLQIVLDHRGVKAALEWYQDLVNIKWKTPNGNIQIRWSPNCCQRICKALAHEGHLDLLEDFVQKCEKEHNLKIKSIKECNTMLIEGISLKKKLELFQNFKIEKRVSIKVIETMINGIFKTPIRNNNAPSSFPFAFGEKTPSNLYSLHEVKEMGKQCLEKLSKLDLKPTAHIYNSIMSFFNDYSAYKHTIEYYESMIQMGLKPNLYTKTIALEAYFALHRVPQAQSLLSEIQKGHVKLDPHLTVVIMNGFLKNRLFGKAINFYQLFLDHGGSPNFYILSMLVNVHCKARNIPAVQEAWSQLLEANYQPNEFLLCCLIDAYGGVGDYDSARQIVDSCKSFGIVPGPVIYNALLYCYVRGEQFELVESLLLEKRSLEIRDDYYTLGILLLYYVKIDNERRLMDIYFTFTGRGYRLTGYIINPMVDYFIRKKNFKRAFAYVQEFQKHSAKTTLCEHTQRILYRALLVNKITYRLAQRFANLMIEQEEPSFIFCNTYMKSLIRHGQYSKLKSVFYKHVIKRCPLTAETYGIYIRGMIAFGDYKEAMYWIEKMTKDGLEITAEISNLIKKVANMPRQLQRKWKFFKDFKKIRRAYRREDKRRIALVKKKLSKNDPLRSRRKSLTRYCNWREKNGQLHALKRAGPNALSSIRLRTQFKSMILENPALLTTK